MSLLKGQTRIFEEVLLFGISVAIFVVCIAIFQMYQQHFGYVSLNDQVLQMGNVMQGHIVEMSRLGAINASAVVNVPREMSGEYYFISLNDTDIVIRTQKTATTYIGKLQMVGKDLGGRFSLSGSASSSKGQVVIYKRGYNIILE